MATTTENVIVNYQLNDKFTGPAAKILNAQQRLNKSTLSGNAGKENNGAVEGVLGLLTASIFGLSSSTKKASKALDNLAKSSRSVSRGGSSGPKLAGVPLRTTRNGGIAGNGKNSVIFQGEQGKILKKLLGLDETGDTLNLTRGDGSQLSQIQRSLMLRGRLLTDDEESSVDDVKKGEKLTAAARKVMKIDRAVSIFDKVFDRLTVPAGNKAKRYFSATNPNFIGPQQAPITNNQRRIMNIRAASNAFANIPRTKIVTGFASDMAKRYLNSLGKLMAPFSAALGPAIQAVALFAVALGAVVTQVIPSLLQAGARLEGLERGVTNAGPDGKRNLGRLRELAKLPGINFEGAASASIQLQAVGFDAILAERAIKGFSNALLRSGKSASELDGIGTALSQIVGKGTVSAEEINQIAERLPSIRRILSETFGTTSGEEITQKVGVGGFITGIIDAVEKDAKNIPQGLGDILSQLNDSFTQVTGKIGIGLGRVLIPILDNVSTAVDKLSSSGFFERLGALSITSFIPAPSEINGIIATIIAGVEQIPSVMSTISSIAAGISSIFKDIAKTILAIENSPIGKVVNFVSDKVGGLIPGYSETKKGVRTVLEGIAGQTGPDFESRRKSILEQLNKAAAPLEDLGKGKLDIIPTEITKVANNTSQLVELQKKAIDLNRQILGGGQLAEQAVSPMNLSSRYPSARTVGDQITRVIYTGMASYDTGYRGRK